MSSHTKDPLEKQDTPSESSESHSDSEVEKAEENLEHLKIEERLGKEATKEDSDESKPLDSPNQEGTLTSKSDLLNEPVAGPSGLQEPRLASSDVISDPRFKAVGFPDPKKEIDVEAKDINENIETGMVEGDSNTSSPPPCIQSSTGITPSSVLQRRSGKEKSPVAGPSRPRAEVEYGKLPLHAVVARFLPRPSQQKSSSSRRFDYATDSANTSSDISEIRSEIADSSAEGSVYHDAPEIFEKEESPSYASAVEMQSSETSDTNISEIQDDDFVPHPTPESSSASTSTPSGEQGYQAYLARLQREADARGEPISTSSGIGSTNQSELANLKAWEGGHHWRNPGDIIDHGAQGEDQQTSESIEDEPILGDEQNRAFDSLFQQQNEEDIEPSEPEAAIRGCVASGMQQVDASGQASNLDGSPSKRRRQSKCLSDSSKEEKGYMKLRQRSKPDIAKKSKMVARKTNPDLQSSSESTEPKSSSSDELHRKESPEMRSSSGTPESDKGRKSYQVPGQLRRLQYSTLSSMDSVIAEEEEDGTSSRQQETKHPTPEKMETTPEKSGEGAMNIEASESKPSIESSYQACVSEAERASKEHDTSFEVQEFERNVGKSKREPKLSNSPPSDEKLGSSPPKAATNRPKKRAKAEKAPAKTRRTRHDSGGSVPKRVGLGNLQKSSESTSTPDKSDYDLSDEEETSL